MRLSEPYALLLTAPSILIVPIRRRVMIVDVVVGWPQLVFAILYSYVLPIQSVLHCLAGAIIV